MAGQETQLGGVDSPVTQLSFDLQIQRLIDRYPALATSHQLRHNQFVDLPVQGVDPLQQVTVPAGKTIPVEMTTVCPIFNGA